MAHEELREVDAEQNIWLTRQEVADRLKVPSATLAQWASQGRGPRYRTFGRHARYSLADITKWENDQLAGGAALNAAARD